MLHRALASLVAVLGVAALALGIASATLWRPSDTLVAEAAAAPGATLLMTDPGVLNMADPEVTVRATGDDVVIALGRTSEVEAWIGRDAHTRVTGLADWRELATQDVPARAVPAEPDPGEPTLPDGGEGVPPEQEGEDAEEPDAPVEGEEDGATEAGATEAGATDEDEASGEPAPPDPRGSDLWWAEVSGGSSAEMEWTETDGRWSVLVASTGAGAGPPGIALTWPQEVVTPWLLPGVVVGALLLMIGAAWWVLILVARRRHSRAASAGPEPEPAPEAVAVPAAPLTRRQMREAAESQGRRRPRRRERDSIVDRFRLLVPAPRKAPEPAPSADAPAGAGATGRVVVESQEAADTPSARRRFALPGIGRRGRLRDAPDRSEGEHAARSSRGAHLHSATDAGSDRPPLPSAPPGAPAASADAWRRAWGLTETDDESSNGGER